MLLLLTSLSQIIGINGNSGNNGGLSTVYPFYFTTTTAAPNVVDKGYVIVGGATRSILFKRNGMPKTVAVPNSATMTYTISGDDNLDRIQEAAIQRDYRDQGQVQPKSIPIPTITPPAVLAERFEPVKRTAEATGSCTADFEQSGAEDLEVGDLGFDDLVPEDRSNPGCDNDIEVSASDLQAATDTLNGLGDDGYQFDNCCGGASDSCAQMAANGTAEVLLCGSDECIGCAQLANYVLGIVETCETDAQQVGGSQAINEVGSLTVSIGLVDTT